MITAAPANGRPRFAIVGMACRFPGIPDVEAFWASLVAGAEVANKDGGLRGSLAYGASPPGRTEGALDIERFDASFFQISPRECARMDPQHRILLEVAWHALEDAGIALPKGGAGGGVFVSTFTGEETALNTGALESHSVYSVLGCSGAATSGRLSTHLGLTGPSLTVDTACSSSLTSLHLAMGALAAGDCEFALVGGVHLMRFADVHACYESAGLLSPSGQCRFGADSANGISRGEGAALVVLKPLERAVADGDRVYAVVLGSAANHNGRRTPHMSRPSPAAQVELLRRAYEHAGCDPAAVDYVECHGTGTLAGDPIEVKALWKALGGAGRKRPLRLGSVKSNLGHTEPVAGIASVVKTALALHHRVLPPTLHVDAPNRRIRWQGGAIDLVRAPTPLPAASPVVAGVSSFGITGSNAHVVLASAEAWGLSPRREDGAPSCSPAPLCVSAADGASLGRVALAYRERLKRASDADYADFAAASRTDRTPLACRLAVVASSRAEAIDRLDGFLSGGEDREGTFAGAGRSAETRVVFAFTGQGGQWWGMAAGLFAGDAAFRRTFERAAAACSAAGGPDLLQLLGEGSKRALEEDLAFIQPAITSYQLALFEALRQGGLRPHLMLGHSMGEIAAAACCGALTIEEAMKVAVVRSRLVSTVGGQGGLLLVEASADEVGSVCGEFGVEVGAYNGPRSFVLSGDVEKISRSEAALAARGLFCRRVRASYASHSAQMEPLSQPIRDALRDLSPRPAALPFRSTVHGLPEGVAPFGAEYWAQNLRRPVGFWQAIAAAVEEGKGDVLVVEIGPHAILGSALEHERVAVDCPVRKGEDELLHVARFICRAFCRGVDLRPARGPRRLSLPLYPFKEERHAALQPNAVDARVPRRYRDAKRELRRAHPLLQRRVDAPAATVFESTVSARRFPYLADHRLMDQVVLPASLYVEMAVAAFHELTGRERGLLRELDFGEMVALQGEEPIFLQLAVADGAQGGAMSVVIRHRREECEEWRVACRGLVQPSAEAPAANEAPAPLSGRDDDLHYRRFAEAGVGYGPHFQTLSRLEALPGGRAVGLASASASVRMPLDGYFFHPAVLDGAFQAFLGCSPEGERDVWVPIGVRGAAFEARPFAGGRVAAELRPTDGGARAEGELALHGDRGPQLHIREFRLQRIARASRRLVFERQWESLELPRRAARSATAVPVVELFADGGAAPPRAEGGGERLALDVRRACAGPAPAADLKRLVQVASELRARLSAEAPPKVVTIVTRGAAAPPGADPRRGSPFAAAVWAMARCLRNEHEETRFELLDVAEDFATPADALGGLLARVAAAGEDEVVLLGDRLLVARVRPAQPPAAASLAGPLFSEGKAYLVAGGAGALGRETLRWMVSQGARRIAVLGRSADGQGRLDPLELGPGVRYAPCDLSDRAAASDALSKLVRETGPIHGAVLATGALRDRAFLNLEERDFADVFLPKAAAAHHLLEALADQPLDFVVGYSSAAAALGSPGQSNYAAANGYLDQLVLACRGRATRCLSVQWGPWEIGGMAAAGLQRHRRSGGGVAALSADEALGALAESWSAGRDLPLVMPLDAELFRLLPGLAETTSFRALAPRAESVEVVDLASALARLPPEQHARAVEELVANEVARILRISAAQCDPSKSLMELGMDSLMALELRRRLEQLAKRRLSTSALVAAPSIAGIARAVAEGHRAPAPAAVARAAEVNPSRWSEGVL